MNGITLRLISLGSALILLISACSTQPPETEILVSLIADGRERTFSYAIPITVSEFLIDADVTLNEFDRVNPEPFNQITDGMIVTVVRVEEETECVESEIPYKQRTVLNEGLAPGEDRIGQAGVNGSERVCYRVRIEDGIRQEPIEISRVELTAPSDEVVYVGPTGQIDPISIVGTLLYIGNGNAWYIRGSSTNKRPITTSGDLDEVVFTASSDGNRLLFTRQTDESDSAFSNELWLLNDINDTTNQPIQLVPENVLQAHWIPSVPNTITYSTGEASETAPGWRAYNDLWAMRIDPRTGEALRIEQIVEPSSFGLYSWWGTQFSWSPNGGQLAWVRADSLGLVNLEDGEFNTLVQYPVFNTRQSWSWRATVSWSPDTSLIATTVHVPIGNYPPETSPAFSTAIVATDDSFDAAIVDNSGIWSSPQFSPPIGGVETDQYYLAYLKARDPFNSINGEYDLVVADQDGSNATNVFPSSIQSPGISGQEFVWSPDGQQIAFIYQGNLWIVDIETGASHQLTLDGNATHPIWIN